MSWLLEDLDVVLDIRLRGPSGPEGSALLKRNWRQVAAGGRADAVVAMRARDRALGVGSWAAGFVSKAETAEHMVQAIHKVLLGTCAESPPSKARSVMQRLTPRQCEVLGLLYQGQSYKLMARLSSVSDNAVRRHGAGHLDPL